MNSKGWVGSCLPARSPPPSLALCRPLAFIVNSLVAKEAHEWLRVTRNKGVRHGSVRDGNGNAANRTGLYFLAVGLKPPPAASAPSGLARESQDREGRPQRINWGGLGRPRLPRALSRCSHSAGERSGRFRCLYFC